MLVLAWINSALAQVDIEAIPNPAEASEIVTASVTGLPSIGGVLDWGDGNTEVIFSDGDYTHSYMTAGSYMIILSENISGLPGPILAREPITVRQAVIDFEVNPNNAEVGEEITATVEGLPTGSSALVMWGDGNTDPITSDGDYTHTYDSPSTYNVHLTDTGGSILGQDTVVIRAPRIDFEVNPNSAEVGEEITATVEGLPTGSSTLIIWGDGNTDPIASDGDYTHTYDSPSTYNVHLTDTGGSILGQDTVVIRAPRIDFEVNPNSAEVGEEITATVEGLPTGSSALIAWGDGNTDSIASDGDYTHTYNSPGTYDVQLTDTGGNILGQDTVVVRAPRIDFEVDPSTQQLGEAVEASIEGFPSNFSGLIQWGDDTSEPINSDGNYPHTYDAPGTYNVQLLDTEGNLLGQDTVNIVMRGDLDADPTEALVNEPVTFTATNLSPGFEHLVDFGDGNEWSFIATANGTSTNTHIYDMDHPIVTAQLFGILNGTRVLLDTIRLSVSRPEANENLSHEAVDTPAVTILIDFTAEELLLGETYLLRFGDGNEQLLPAVEETETIQHGYISEGTYTAQLFLQTNNGESLEATDIVNARWIRGDENLSLITDEPKSGENTEFEANELVSVYSYDIVFGDPANTQTPTFTGVSNQSASVVYPEVDAYTAQLFATYPDNLRELRDTVVVATRAGFAITEFDWEFSGDSSLSDDDFSGISEVVQLNEGGLTATLDYTFEGVGVFEATINVERNSTVLETVNVVLSGSPSDRSYTTLPLPTDQEGNYTLTLSVLNPEQIFALPPLSYAVIDSTNAQNVNDVNINDITNGNNTQQTNFSDVQRLNFAGFIVAVTEVSNSDLDNFSGEGILEDFIFAGRLQTVEVRVEFDNLTIQEGNVAGLYNVLTGQAIQDISDSVNLSLPAVVQGLGIQLNGMVLDPTGARIDGQAFLPFKKSGGIEGFKLNTQNSQNSDSEWKYVPVRRFSASNGGSSGGIGNVSGAETLTYKGVPVTGKSIFTAPDQDATAIPSAQGLDFQNAGGGLPPNRVIFKNQPLSPEGDFSYSGIARIDEDFAIGETGVAFKARQFPVLIDLSKTTNEDQSTLNSAYRAWEEPDQDQGNGLQAGFNFADAGSPPSTPYTSVQWMGLVFPDAHLRSNNLGLNQIETDTAWVAAGFQSLIAKAGDAVGDAEFGDWNVDLLNLVVGIKNSILIDAGALGEVYLPFFDETMRVRLHQTNGGGSTMKAIAPVAHVYGHTAIIGEGAVFFTYSGNVLLGFNDAKWAFNGNLDAPTPPSSPSSGGGILGPNTFKAPGTQNVTRLDFIKENYKRKFHIRNLVLEANGDAYMVKQQGNNFVPTNKMALWEVPSLDFLNFPFLDGGAWISLEQQGTTYTLGLEGKLELASNLGGISASTHYSFKNGQEQIWEFEGAVNADVKAVHFSLEVGGEVDLTNKDIFFYAVGNLTIEELFEVQAEGAFGRQQGERYWFISAALNFDGLPIVDTGFVAFYSFKGGIAHHIKHSLTGNCSILDTQTLVKNANDCVDFSNDWTFLAGTVIAPSEGYGGDTTIHVSGELIISEQGGVDIVGQAWLGKSFNQGYNGNKNPQAAAHLGFSKERVVLTACVGPSGSSQGAPANAQTISCEGLDPLRYPTDSVAIAEFKGWGGLLIDWTNDQYYLAVGHYNNRVQAKFFGLIYREGYLVAGTGLPSNWLPDIAQSQPGIGSGFYAGRATGYKWDFEYSWGTLCKKTVWADVDIGSEMNLFLVPSPFSMGADVAYWVSVGVGYDGCVIHLGVRIAGNLDASIIVSQQLGQLTGNFDGKIQTKKLFGDGYNNLINIDIGVKITLWE